MKIMKISKYVAVKTPSRGGSDMEVVRHMLLSLPRIMWLERDPDPSMHTASYTPEESYVDLKNMDSYVVLTKREEEIHRMSEQGFNPPQIANKKKMGLPNVLRSLDMARKKLAIIRARRDNKKTRSNTQTPGS